MPESVLQPAPVSTNSLGWRSRKSTSASVRMLDGACTSPISLPDRLDKPCEIGQRLGESGLVILRRDAGRNVFRRHRDQRAFVTRFEQPGDAHLAGELRIIRFELDGLDDHVIGDEPQESAAGDVRMVRGLALMITPIVGERDSVLAIFTWI